MEMPPFKVEEFWKQYEFSAPYLLCSSDAETWSLKELLSMADSETLKLWDAMTLGYTESPGHPLLRIELSRLYETLKPDEILTLAGAEEGIYCSLRVLIEPKDHVIVIDPCYESLINLPKIFGADITQVRLKPENGWKLDLEDMLKAFRPETKLVILNFPHNPTGTVLDQETLDGIIHLARKCGAYIFCDEVYRFLEVSEARRVPSMADAYEKGISLNVMTKSFGLAGVRVGWVASKDSEFLKKVGSYKLYTSICNSSPSEILSIIALRSKEKILGRNRLIMNENLKLLDAFIERNKDRFSWEKPQSGNMALVELLGSTSVADFSEEMVKKEGVLIMPCTLFDLPGNYFRIGFGKKSMPDILKRFEAEISSFSF